MDRCVPDQYWCLVPLNETQATTSQDLAFLGLQNYSGPRKDINAGFDDNRAAEEFQR